MLNKPLNSKGITLIEFTIYLAIIAMVLLTIVRFGWAVLGAGTKVEVSSELTQNSRLVLERVTQEIRAADALLADQSVWGTNPGVLLVEEGGANSRIDTYLKTITVGGQALQIRKLRMQEGANPASDLTSDRVDVTNFVVRNLTEAGAPASIGMELTFEAVQAGQDPMRDRSISVQTSASIRKTSP